VGGGALRRSVYGRLRTGDAANDWPPTWRSGIESMACILNDFRVEVDVWIEESWGHICYQDRGAYL